MRRKSYSEEQIMAIFNEAESGIPVTELCCKHGMAGATLYT